MTRSSKRSNISQPRSLVFGTLSAAAVAILLLFLYLQNSSFTGNPSPPEPQGSWRQVHQALGFSPGIPPTTYRKQIPIQPSSGHNFPLRLIDLGNDLESTEHKTYLLRDFTAALQSISRGAKRRK